jgi:hypothetical protein
MSTPPHVSGMARLSSISPSVGRTDSTSGRVQVARAKLDVRVTGRYRRGMRLLQALTKPPGVTTPKPLLIGVAVVAFVHFNSLFQAFGGGQLGAVVVRLPVELAVAVVLCGLLSMKRWAVVVYVVAATVLLVSAALTFGRTEHIRGVIAGAVLHLAVIGPALFYWRRMTWT